MCRVYLGGFLGVCVSLVCIIYGCWAWNVILVFGEFGFGFGGWLSWAGASDALCGCVGFPGVFDLCGWVM